MANSVLQWNGSSVDQMQRRNNVNKKISVLFLSLVFGTATAFAASTAFAVNGGCNDWNFALDYLRAPNQTPPQPIIPDSCGTPVWYFMDSVDMTQTPANYKLLDTFTNNFPECPDAVGLKWWSTSTNYPIVYANLDINQTCGATYRVPVMLPVATAFVHPAPSSAAVVAWKSPVSGRVQIEVNLADIDAMCGDGQNWFVQKGSTLLGSGSIGNAGAAHWLKSGLSITAGEFLYIGVGPAGEYSCDTTALDITITNLLDIPVTPVTRCSGDDDREHSLSKEHSSRRR